MPDYSKRPSLKAIADRVGVSKATVSRALRGLPGQSESTREKIAEAAQELGYVRHPLVAALMSDLRYKNASSFSPVIALVHVTEWDGTLALNMAEFRDATKKHADKLGYSIEEFNLSDPNLTPARLVRILEARGIRGVIFEHFLNRNQVIELDLSQFASVAIGFPLNSPYLHRICADQFSAVFMAIEKLRSLGYRRFGFAIPALNESFTYFTREAALRAAQRSLPEEDRIPMLTLPKDYSEIFVEWVQEHQPDVVLSIRPEIPDLLSDMGLRIPQDIAFAHLAWHRSYKNLGGINPHWDQIAVAATNQVVDQLNRNEFGIPERPIVTFIEGEWIDGPSVPHKVPVRESIGVSR